MLLPTPPFEVVVHDGRILEKPVNEEEVRRNIAGYAVSCFAKESTVRRIWSTVLGLLPLSIATESLLSDYLASVVVRSMYPRPVMIFMCGQNLRIPEARTASLLCTPSTSWLREET